MLKPKYFRLWDVPTTSAEEAWAAVPYTLQRSHVVTVELGGYTHDPYLWVCAEPCDPAAEQQGTEYRDFLRSYRKARAAFAAVYSAAQDAWEYSFRRSMGDGEEEI